MEISELQAHQRGEIELLYLRLGKAPPPGLSLTATVPPAGRRRRASKHKLRASKLLSPLVQQIRSVTKTSDSSKPGDAPFLLQVLTKLLRDTLPMYYLRASQRTFIPPRETRTWWLARC